MIFEARTYTTHYGKLSTQLELWSEHGLPIVAEHLGYPVIIGVHQDGDVNSYLHTYRFENAEDRLRKRATLVADPRMQSYLAKVRAANTLLKQDSRILAPPPFFDQARAISGR